MKTYLLSAAIAVSCLAACKKKATVPSILEIDPEKGAASIPVTITGLHFDTVISHILVKFNGVNATVYSANDSVVVALVPRGAATGKVTLSFDGVNATSADDFIILSGGWVQKASLPEPQLAGGRGLGCSPCLQAGSLRETASLTPLVTFLESAP